MTRQRVVVGATDHDDRVFAVARTLRDAGREVVHYHVDDPDADFSRAIESIALDLG